MKKIFTILFFAIIGLNNIDAATFTSVSSGTWSTPATWSIVGVDSDGIPDADDNITINNGHTITLSVSVNSFKTLTIQTGGVLNANSKNLYAYGNCTINGNMINPVYFQVRGICTLSSVPTLTNTLNWTVQPGGDLTIAANTIINKLSSFIIVSDARSVINNGNVSANIILNGTGSWTNASGSILTTTSNITGPGSLITSAASNTVVYNGTAVKQIYPSTYYDLVLNAASTKSLTTNLVVLNNLTLGVGNVLDLKTFNLTLGGNLTNTANSTILNQGVISFNGSGTQVISRASNEIINNMVVNGTGTVQLGRSINISQSLTMSSGTLDPSASNYTINIAGNLIFNGGAISQRGELNFNGTSAQTISGSSVANLYNVRSSNSNASGVLVTADAVISNTLMVVSGKFGTSGSGSITIPATGATNYGRIGPVGGTLVGTGWKIESYINGPAQMGWQWLSSPINGNILKDWDDDPRFYMSGVGGNDGTASGFRSVRTYDEPTDTRQDITSINTLLTPGKGFELWMADNKTTGLTAPLVYNSIGTPNFGTIQLPVTSGGSGSGYNLVGNPYACPITYSTVVATSGNLYSSFIIYQENKTYATDPNGGIIAPNQGFMCVASSNGNIIFTEAAKNISSTPNILRSNVSKSDLITFEIYNNINGLSGQTNVLFSNNASDIFEREKDLPFIASPSDDADNIWTNTSDNRYMLKNVLNLNDEEKHIPLTVKSGVYGLHDISVKGLSNLTSYNDVVLEDLSNEKKIDLIKEQTYRFNVDQIGKEYNFIVHFSKNRNITGINENLKQNILNQNTSIYNTSSSIVVKFNMPGETPVEISVYNVSGQLITRPMNLTVIDDRIAIPLQKENGLYLLLIKSQDQQIIRKIIY